MPRQSLPSRGRSADNNNYPSRFNRVESLETRCLLSAGGIDLDALFGKMIAPLVSAIEAIEVDETATSTDKEQSGASARGGDATETQSSSDGAAAEEGPGKSTTRGNKDKDKHDKEGKKDAGNEEVVAIGEDVIITEPIADGAAGGGGVDGDFVPGGGDTNTQPSDGGDAGSTNPGTSPAGDGGGPAGDDGDSSIGDDLAPGDDGGGLSGGDGGDPILPPEPDVSEPVGDNSGNGSGNGGGDAIGGNTGAGDDVAVGGNDDNAGPGNSGDSSSGDGNAGADNSGTDTGTDSANSGTGGDSSGNGAETPVVVNPTPTPNEPAGQSNNDAGKPAANNAGGSGQSASNQTANDGSANTGDDNGDQGRQVSSRPEGGEGEKAAAGPTPDSSNQEPDANPAAETTQSPPPSHGDGVAAAGVFSSAPVTDDELDPSGEAVDELEPLAAEELAAAALAQHDLDDQLRDDKYGPVGAGGATEAQRRIVKRVSVRVQTLAELAVADPEQAQLAAAMMAQDSTVVTATGDAQAEEQIQQAAMASFNPASPSYTANVHNIMAAVLAGATFVTIYWHRWRKRRLEDAAAAASKLAGLLRFDPLAVWLDDNDRHRRRR